jgi:hypothetical protein
MPLITSECLHTETSPHLGKQGLSSTERETVFQLHKHSVLSNQIEDASSLRKNRTHLSPACFKMLFTVPIGKSCRATMARIIFPELLWWNLRIPAGYRTFYSGKRALIANSGNQ